MQDNLEKLIAYRIEQALKTISEVELLIEKDLLAIAINRIYYGMFYMLLPCKNAIHTPVTFHCGRVTNM